MKRAIILANGKMEKPPMIPGGIQATDLVIAADGGSRHCKELGIRPGVIIGDFDSLEAGEVEGYRQARVEIVRHPTHKDETDLELALQLAAEREIDRVYILGALGARWDMTIANILLPAQSAYRGLKIYLLEGSQEMLFIRGTEQVEVESQPGDPISLIPLGGDVHGITTQGLEYPLKNESLIFGSPRGVSNVLVSTRAKIEVREGTLLCIVRGQE